ncbi:cation diffusion facilitator family transporter [Arcicella sp. LKC2W]|uniref:cation diffusion facilitator family transporter n=1 Tax=Arcicella sp. LKC2W TaxID=2984198 RepID=UPI002B21224D|nr:cation diffusion facilitator family transporter [Arcicella sp. LKC2W]MEA5458544.1 cation diffusion facilitator family transporter [Arcicella sp. LKC2W]
MTELFKADFLASDFKKYKWIFLSFVISTLLMIGKFIAYYTTYSSAILTDALESIINVVASAFAFYAIYLASQPKDLNHPYGHGKIEFFSAGLEGVLIVLASVFIVFHASESLIHPTQFNDLQIGLIIISAGTIINYLLGYFIEKEGVIRSSPTLIADGKHLKLDAVSGLILVTAVILVYLTNIVWIDGVASIIFALFMAWNGVKIIRKSIGGLMDETNEEVLEKVVDILKSNQKNDWIDMHNLRIQEYGADIHIDAHLTLPRYWNLEKVHEVVHEFEDIIGESFNSDVEIFIHTDPCLPECCHYCKIENCPIRQVPKTVDIDWNKVNLSLNQKHFLEKI